MTALLFAAVVCQAVPCAITDVRVEVGDGTVLERATVIIEDGRIRDVLSDADVPADATVIEGEGRVLTPGLVETQTRLGLTEVTGLADTNDFVVGGQVAVPAFRAAEGFNPFSVWIPITREEGITSAVTRPTGALLHGQGYWIDLTGSLESAPDPKAPVAQFGAVHRGAANAVGGARGALWLELRRIFADARFYRSRRSDHDAGRARALALHPTHLEALFPVLDRKLPLVLDADRASDLLAAIDFARTEKIRLVIVGGMEAWRVAEQLAAARVPVVLRPSTQVPRSFDTLQARDDAPALLAAAGVELIISASSWSQNVRRLRQEAGVAVAYGLPRDRALAAITATPARVFGRGDELGRVAAGLRANLVLWSGDPLELSSTAELVLIDGVEQPLANRQRSLAERYLQR